MTTAIEPTWQIKMLFDGQCPLCSREVALLRKRNARGLIAFEDIADPTFDAAKYGLTLDALIGSMHAVRPDGSVIQGIDVFAEVYAAAGWGWLALPIRWRLTRPICRAVYRVFAAIRPRLSGFKSPGCDDKCKLPRQD